MKRYIVLLMSSALLLLAGCSGNTAEKSVMGSGTGTAQTESAQNAESTTVREEITRVIMTSEAADTDGEPAIADYQGIYYRYAGRRWWKDLDQPAGSFILKDDGKYYPFLDEENDPGAAINPEFKVYQTVESFNEGGWEYAGSIDGKDFYVDSGLDTMLCFVDVTDHPNNPSKAPAGEKLYMIGVLAPSIVGE